MYIYIYIYTYREICNYIELACFRRKILIEPNCLSSLGINARDGL